MINLEWWSAVSLGRKPVPGGVTKVLRGLATMLPCWSTIPMPILLALPSMPRTYGFMNYNTQMKRIALVDKIQQIKAASQFEHKLVDSIHRIMGMKRKAESDYKASLQLINRQLEKYIVQDNGYLTEIIKAFQSYITVIHQNQHTLIEGYDQQILAFLAQARNSQVEEDLIQRVTFFDQQVTRCQQNVHSIKKTIKDNQTELQVLASEVTLAKRVGTISGSESKAYEERYGDLQQLKQRNEEKLEGEVDGMMELTMSHNQLLKDLEDYETIYLEKKGSQVFDIFMRAFVLEVSFIRSMQFDVGHILQRVRDNQEQHRKVALDALRARMRKESSVTSILKDAYKRVTGPGLLQIDERYISERIRQKWGRICEYYSEASA